MNFKEQKQAIVDFIVNGLIKSESSQDLAVMTVKFNQLMEELQPPRPTCSTCRYFITDKDVSKFKNGCSKLVWRVEFEPTRFGCNGHADYEVRDE